MNGHMRTAALVLAGLGASLAASEARAGVYIGGGFVSYSTHVVPPPVVVQPPVYVSSPVMVTQPVYVPPAPVVVSSPVVSYPYPYPVVSSPVYVAPVPRIIFRGYPRAVYAAPFCARRAYGYPYRGRGFGFRFGFGYRH